MNMFSTCTLNDDPNIWEDLERFRSWSLVNSRIIDKIFDSPCQPRLSGTRPFMNMFSTCTLNDDPYLGRS